MSTFEALGTHYVKCCATCQHWQRFKEVEQFGLCREMYERAPDVTLVEREGFASRPVFASSTTPMTTDLQLCSKWQEKAGG